MIRLDRVELANGTIYHNIYYGQEWEDLEFLSESDVPTILFYYKKKGAFKEFELKPKEITNIVLGKGESGDSDFFLFYDDRYKRPFLANIYTDCDIESVSGHNDIQEVQNFAEDLFSQVLDLFPKINDKNRAIILDNMVSVIIGYMEAAYDLHNDDTKHVDISSCGYIVSMIATSYIYDKIKSKDNYAFLLKDVTEIVSDFLDYMEKTPKKGKDTDHKK